MLAQLILQPSEKKCRSRSRFERNVGNISAFRVWLQDAVDTAEEVAIYQAGGVLQRFAQDFLEASNAA